MTKLRALIPPEKAARVRAAIEGGKPLVENRQDARRGTQDEKIGSEPPQGSEQGADKPGLETGNSKPKTGNAQTQTGTAAPVTPNPGQVQPLHPNELLLRGIEQNNLQQVQDAIFLGADLNRPNRKGQTRLSIAVILGHREIIDLLFEKGADPAYYSLNGWDGPLFWAVDKSDVESVRLFLSNPQAVHYAENDRCENSAGGYGVLVLAAQKNSLDTVLVLLDHGVTTHMDCALIEAIENKNEAMFDALFSKGAKPNTLQYGRYDEKDATTLAAQKGLSPVLKKLLDSGVQVDIKHLLAAAGSGDVATIELLLARGADKFLNPADNHIGGIYAHLVPLMVAAHHGHADAVRVLLNHGADPKLRDLDGETAVTKAHLQGHTAVLDVFKKHAEGKL